jgi:predicted nucleic acid-binding protein
MDAFDSDVLIYAAVRGHPLGRRVLALFPDGATPTVSSPAGIGSVLLLPELLAKPLRSGGGPEMAMLHRLLARLDLRPVDAMTAQLAVALAAEYRLRATDAVHLATAVNAGADRFITNNSKDFAKAIVEIDVTYPTDLDDPGTT